MPEIPGDEYMSDDPRIVKRRVALKMPKGHEPVYVIVVSALEGEDRKEGHTLGVTPQWMPLAEKMVDFIEPDQLALEIGALVNRGWSNTVATLVDEKVLMDWRTRSKVHQRRIPPGVGS